MPWFHTHQRDHNLIENLQDKVQCVQPFERDLELFAVEAVMKYLFEVEVEKVWHLLHYQGLCRHDDEDEAGNIRHDPVLFDYGEAFIGTHA